MDRDDALAAIEQLHAAQARLYMDGDVAAAREMLSADITWHVPGRSPIAGSYRGRDEVIEYMLARRVLANGTFRMHRLDVLTGSGSTVAVLTDGSAQIDGVDRRWSTVGLYRLEDGRVAECWLLPLDQAEFDDIWTPRGAARPATARPERRGPPRSQPIRNPGSARGGRSARCSPRT
jgi:ketosteroid isomerase-like protein